MKTLLLLWISVTPLAGAVVEVISALPKAVFGGGSRTVEFMLRNRTGTNVQLSVGLQLLQSSSATVAPWSEMRPWRSLALLPHQTSIERVTIDFPGVREQSPFWVRLASGQEILGVIPVAVHPGGILSKLTNSLGPVTSSFLPPDLWRVLTDAGFALIGPGTPTPIGAQPRLAIYGPQFSAKDTSTVIAEAKSLARTGLGVVLILPDYNEQRITAPSYYPVCLGRGTLVAVREGTLTNLLANPLAQLRLARIIRLALGQEKLSVTESSNL